MPDDFPWDPAEEDTEKPTWPNPPPGYYVNNPETRPDYEEPASGNLADVTADEALGDDGMGCGSAVATGGLTWLLLAFMATCLGRLRRRRDAGAR